MQVHDYTALWVLCTCVALLIIIPWLVEGARGRFSWFNLKNPFLLFVLLQFAAWPMLVYTAKYETSFASEVTFWTTRYATFLEGQIYVMVAVLCFYAGYYLDLIGRRRPAKVGETAESAPAWDPSRADMVLIGSVAIASLSFGMMMLSAGGFSYYIQNIDLLRTTTAAGWGIYLFPMLAAHVGILFYTIYAFRSGRGRYRAYAGTLLVLGFGFVIGIRHLLVGPIVGFAIAYHCLYRRVRFTWKTWLAIAAFAVFNMAYAVFRGAGLQAFNIVRSLDPAIFVYGLLGRFHGGESMARILEIVPRTDYQYGVLALRDMVLNLIPRGLWPGKPVSSGVISNVTFWPEAFTLQDTGSAVTTLIGELYWIFGGVAIVAGMFTIGRIFRGQVRRLAEHNGSDRVGTYALWFIFALFVNESLTLHLFQLLFKLAVWFVLLRYVRHVSRAPAKTAVLEAPLPAG